ncbi:phosphonate C-P lyase system protein PhnG [Mesorhizobium sp.]|uniref:phosphonate C-P lyase system protein PhnG n=1 Tax=Mesorhizobium sp. TaxID=1871066 RepID=UPI000FE584D7|nr:phosphonate C-P lyase system protein PhnG [Mesorhizobium sp.]RWJ43149.1 MAG: phosphonate C-P lyase system protein PhnG [Mesorhizobium sp.]
MQEVTPSNSSTERSTWMGVLSRSDRDHLTSLVKDVTNVPFVWLRKPQVGLVMVRGRAGGTGAAFNLGEMTVTRCALQLEDGTVGQGYVQGRDKRHAKCAALVDALLQQESEYKRLLASVIEPLKERQAERKLEQSRKAAATKVDFFTMVRGGDPE